MEALIIVHFASRRLNFFSDSGFILFGIAEKKNDISIVELNKLLLLSI